jgi:electron transfer flavoprotein alpha subunit
VSKVLVFAESAHDHLKRSTIELLTAAKNSNQTVVGLAVGTHAKKLATEMGLYGATEVHIFADASFDIYNPQHFLLNLAPVIKNSQSKFLLAAATSLGKDFFPRLAAHLETGIASDCTELTFNGENATVRKPLYSGKCTAQVEFKQSSPQIILMRPNQLPVQEAGTGTAQIVEHPTTKSDLATLVKEVVRGASEKLDLTEANIIVSGGRGLKEAANFKILENLADVLGASVGASRAVVDAGWVDHGMQVGQTGKTVAPTLYIAVGISGAIQHLAGMSGSKVIVAINNDANAPIFQKATYGIVGDALEIIPQLTEEFKKVLG